MEPFSVLINDTSYEVRPYVKGYTVSLHVEAGNSTIVFELDEEDQLRALTSGEPVSPKLIDALADAIITHFGK